MAAAPAWMPYSIETDLSTYCIHSSFVRSCSINGSCEMASDLIKVCLSIGLVDLRLKFDVLKLMTEKKAVLF